MSGATISAVWRVLYWAWVLAEVGVVIATYTRSGSGEVRDRGSLRWLWGTIFCSIWAASDLAQRRGPTMFHDALWVRELVLALLVVGIGIRWTAIITLGRSFSVNVAIHAKQTVKRTGIFRYARHPSYTGLILVFVALGLHLRNWAALAVITVPSLVALLYRMRVEEDALTRAFGEEYISYSTTTKRLIPGIY
jgi:protein-S-isoprenylcysteine O-methyltransferase Ste14